MELAERGTLENLFSQTEAGRISLQERFRLGLGITNGVKDLHSHNIVHKDLKPDNILIMDDMRAVISDLGLSSISQNASQSSDFGCQIFRAPEIIQNITGMEEDGLYAHKAMYNERYQPATNEHDIFSLGLLLFYVFTGLYL